MRKIPTVFVRSKEDRRFVTREVTPGCEWVFADPSAIPTRKYDGTCVCLDGTGLWWARREIKASKTAPPYFREVQRDPVTGRVVGWEPMEQSGFARWHDEAVFEPDRRFSPGTYELIGPKINGNPEGASRHKLIRHEAADVLVLPSPSFDLLAAYLPVCPFEGIVWHHPDGRMAKLKRRDFPKGGQ